MFKSNKTKIFKKEGTGLTCYLLPYLVLLKTLLIIVIQGIILKKKYVIIKE
jgi:hypothetical protein